MKFRGFSLGIALLCALPLNGADVPSTPKHPVTDTYFDTLVVDDYRWLENGDDPAVRRWCMEQNALTRKTLDPLPSRAALAKRLEELNLGASPDYFGIKRCEGRLFALKMQPPRNQPLLIALDSADNVATAKTIVDLHQLDPEDATAIDFYVPSHDGKLVAVCLSRRGSEDGAVAVFETETGRKLDEHVPRVNYPTAGGGLAWNADASGFWYTRYPQGDERAAEDRNFYQQIYFHQLGRPAKEDQYVLGRDFPRIAEIDLESTEDGRWVLATVANGDGGEFAHYLRNRAGEWTQITQHSDQIPQVDFGPGDTLYLLSRKSAPHGQVLRMSRTSSPLSDAKIVVPESEVVIRGMTLTKRRLYVVDLAGGPSQLRAFDLAGGRLEAPKTAAISSIGQVVALEGDTILYRTESFLEPAAWFRFDPVSGESQRTALYRTTPADFRDCEVVREFDRDLRNASEHMFSAINLDAKFWTPRLVEHCCSQINDAGYPVSARAKLLSALVENAPSEIAPLLQRWVHSDEPNAIRTAAIDGLLVLAPESALPIVRREYDREGRTFLKALTHLRLHNRGRIDLTSTLWTGPLLAEVYRILRREFPPSSDDRKGGFVTPDMELTEIRGSIPSILYRRDSPIDREQLEILCDEFTDIREWVEHRSSQTRLSAEVSSLNQVSDSDRIPLSNLIKLIENPSYRIIRSEDDLLEVIEDTLNDIGKSAPRHLEMLYLPADQATPGHRRDESALQTYVECRLSDLVPGRVLDVGTQVIIDREPQRGRRRRFDVKVTAPLLNGASGTVVVEIKWSDNKDRQHNVSTALMKQLGDKYLIDENLSHGLYLVGWNGRLGKWSTDGGPRPAETHEALKSALVQQAENYIGAHSGLAIRVVLFDLRYSTDDRNKG